MMTPAELKRSIPLSAAAAATVREARQAIEQILSGDDHRLLVVVGPCSIHDTDAACEYGERLGALARDVEDSLVLIMRTYLEKPRSNLGWRGLLSDPRLDGSNDLASGLVLARTLLSSLNAQGVPCATESLDPLLVRYTDDLVAWTALGARTSESQVHRAMASGLPIPVGIKNGTDGRLETVLDALQTARAPQAFPAMSEAGRMTLERSSGNGAAHVVLRGGLSGPNYDEAAIDAAQMALRARGLPQNLIVDCSHANSGKQAVRQLDVMANVGKQIEAGNRSIVGLMLESHLNGGKQAVGERLAYGVSITDECLDWQSTHEAIQAFRSQAGDALRKRQAALAA